MEENVEYTDEFFPVPEAVANTMDDKTLHHKSKISVPMDLVATVAKVFFFRNKFLKKSNLKISYFKSIKSN